MDRGAEDIEKARRLEGARQPQAARDLRRTVDGQDHQRPRILCTELRKRRHIDFYKQPQFKAAFVGSLESTAIVSAIEALVDKPINPQSTLIFFDEVQACDEALASLKFFCTDAPQYQVIAAGSLLGVHVAREGPFPVGYVEMITMHPMDFEEFC